MESERVARPNVEDFTSTRYQVYRTLFNGEVVEFWGNTGDGQIGVVEVSRAALEGLLSEGGSRQNRWAHGVGENRPTDATTIRQGKKARYARPYAGSNRYMPLTFDLVKDALPATAKQPGTFLATHAWVDPWPERYFLHLICVGPKGGISYCNIWLADLGRILRILEAQNPAPQLFILSPDVVTLETTGRSLIDEGLVPKEWVTALEREPPHVEPGYDLVQKRIPKRKRK